MGESKRISARLDENTEDILDLYCAMYDEDISTAVRRGIQRLEPEMNNSDIDHKVFFEDNLRLLLSNLSSNYKVFAGSIFYNHEGSMELMCSIMDISKFIVDKNTSYVFLVYPDGSKLKLGKDGNDLMDVLKEKTDNKN